MQSKKTLGTSMTCSGTSMSNRVGGGGGRRRGGGNVTSLKRGRDPRRALMLLTCGSSQLRVAHGLSFSCGECFCAGLRHSAGFYARVVLDGVACRLGDPGEVDDVLGVLGVDRVVPIVVRVLESKG